MRTWVVFHNVNSEHDSSFLLLILWFQLRILGWRMSINVVKWTLFFSFCASRITSLSCSLQNRNSTLTTFNISQFFDCASWYFADRVGLSFLPQIFSNRFVCYSGRNWLITSGILDILSSSSSTASCRTPWILRSTWNEFFFFRNRGPCTPFVVPAVINQVLLHYMCPCAPPDVLLLLLL